MQGSLDDSSSRDDNLESTLADGTFSALVFFTEKDSYSFIDLAVFNRFKNVRRLVLHEVCANDERERGGGRGFAPAQIVCIKVLDRNSNDPALEPELPEYEELQAQALAKMRPAMHRMLCKVHKEEFANTMAPFGPPSEQDMPVTFVAVTSARKAALGMEELDRALEDAVRRQRDGAVKIFLRDLGYRGGLAVQLLRAQELQRGDLPLLASMAGMPEGGGLEAGAGHAKVRLEKLCRKREAGPSLLENILASEVDALVRPRRPPSPPRLYCAPTLGFGVILACAQPTAAPPCDNPGHLAKPGSFY